MSSILAAFPSTSLVVLVTPLIPDDPLIVPVLGTLPSQWFPAPARLHVSTTAADSALPEISSFFAAILLFHQLFTSGPSLVELATLTIGK
jgi:hypothetical protein